MPQPSGHEQDYAAFIDGSLQFDVLYESRVFAGEVSPVVNNVWGRLGLYETAPVLRFYSPVQGMITAEQLMSRVPAFPLPREAN